MRNALGEKKKTGMQLFKCKCPSYAGHFSSLVCPFLFWTVTGAYFLLPAGRALSGQVVHSAEISKVGSVQWWGVGGAVLWEHSYLATKLLLGREDVQTLQERGVKSSLTARLSPEDLYSIFVPSANYSLAS